VYGFGCDDGGFAELAGAVQDDAPGVGVEDFGLDRVGGEAEALGCECGGIEEVLLAVLYVLRFAGQCCVTGGPLAPAVQV
jgi:hypothetical protein